VSHSCVLLRHRRSDQGGILDVSSISPLRLVARSTEIFAHHMLEQRINKGSMFAPTSTPRLLPHHHAGSVFFRSASSVIQEVQIYRRKVRAKWWISKIFQKFWLCYCYRHFGTHGPFLFFISWTTG
jgi:hypothetical protein